MSWVKIDDQAPRHEKMLTAGAAACWLWVCAIAHSQSQLTDGFVSDAALPMIGVAKNAAELAARLVSVRLMERVEGGFKVHDYLDHNQSREQVLLARRQEADRKAAGRRTDSGRSPNGVRPDGGADSGPDSGVPIPSHPIQTKDTYERRALNSRPFKGSGGVLAGAYPRDHLTHALCDDRLVWCVPGPVHQKLSTSLAPKHGGDRHAAGKALETFYREVWASLPADHVIGDQFKFWQKRFDERFASADGGSGPDASHVAPSATATKAYLAGLPAKRRLG